MEKKEFIAELEELGLEYLYGRIYVNGMFAIEVSEKNVNEFSTIDKSHGATHIGELDEEEREQLMSLVLEYSRTPISDREENYYLRFKGMMEQCSYLMKAVGGYRLGEKRSKFTVDEIRDLPSELKLYLSNGLVEKERA